MEKWVVSAKRADFEQLANKFGIDPVIARLIRNRDQITDREIDRYLHGKAYRTTFLETVKGYGQAAGHFGRKNQRAEKNQNYRRLRH